MELILHIIYNELMKNVQAYGNKDNLHCLQSCVRSTLEYFIPNKRFSKNYIDSKTLFDRKSLSWILPSVVWLDYLGLKVKLFSPFDYPRLIREGEGYLREFKGEDIFNYERSKGSYLNLDQIRKSAEEMIKKNLWVNRLMEIDELTKLLVNNSCLAIGKTIHEWLSNNFVKQGTQHYILFLEANNNQKWIVHDPGKPLIKYREIQQLINNYYIYGDILLIER